MNKKRIKKYGLKFETLRSADLEKANGGMTRFFCDTTDPCAVSRGFTNCTYCDSYSAEGSTCAFCPV